LHKLCEMLNRYSSINANLFNPLVFMKCLCHLSILSLISQFFYSATIIYLGNGRKTPFWHAPWLGGKMPKDIAPKKLRYARERIERLHKHFMKTSGLKRLALMLPYLLSISHNLCNYGPSYKMCILMRKWRMIFGGSLRAMGNTPRLPYTSCNFLSLLSLPLTSWYGKLGLCRK
jgi:hypothetical protein